MSVRRFWSIIGLSAMLAGCTAASVNRDLGSHHIGRSGDAFFRTWGGPVSSRATGNGGRLYLWFSGRDSAYRPGDKGTVDLIGNTSWWAGRPLDGYNPLLECRLEILVGRKGHIEAIRMFGGERDWQHRQRCREVFAGGRPG
jgi:hypothetical protein